MWKTINPHKELLVYFWIHPGRLELEHDGLVQMIFLFNWVIFRFQPVIFQYSVDTPSISNGFGNTSKNTFCLSTFPGRSLGSSFTWTCGLHVETILAALGPINTSWWLDTTSRTDISPFRVVGRFIWYDYWSGMLTKINFKAVNLLSKRIQHNFYFHHFLTGATNIIHTLKFNIAPKIGGWKITFLLGWLIFRGLKYFKGVLWLYMYHIDIS